MGAPAIAAGAIGAGTIISVIGQRKADEAEAAAEERNAEFLREQEKFATMAAEREVEIFKDEADELLSAQRTAFTKAGVSISGSPLLRLMDTQEKIDGEVAAIRKEGNLRIRLARFRAESSDRRANDIRSTMNMRTTGTLLTGSGQALAGAS